jgi:quercetin dioxygenase-like cupin family protein
MRLKALIQRLVKAGMNDTSSVVKGKAFNLKADIDYADGSVVSKTLIKKDIGNITLFAFDAGQGLSEHTAPFDAVVYIMGGEAEITIGGQPQDVVSGEMLIMPANISHALHAKKPFKMLLVMIRGE